MFNKTRALAVLNLVKNYSELEAFVTTQCLTLDPKDLTKSSRFEGIVSFDGTEAGVSAEQRKKHEEFRARYLGPNQDENFIDVYYHPNVIVLNSKVDTRVWRVSVRVRTPFPHQHL